MMSLNNVSLTDKIDLKVFLKTVEPKHYSLESKSIFYCKEFNISTSLKLFEL